MSTATRKRTFRQIIRAEHPKTLEGLQTLRKGATTTLRNIRDIYNSAESDRGYAFRAMLITFVEMVNPNDELDKPAHDRLVKLAVLLAVAVEQLESTDISSDDAEPDPESVVALKLIAGGLQGNGGAR